SSYLINYRYSTLALLGRFLPLGSQPEYQDASLKLNFPTEKAGTFSIFGLGGYNVARRKIAADSSEWNDDEGNVLYTVTGLTGAAGPTPQPFLTRSSDIRTVLSASYDRYQEEADTLTPAYDYRKDPVPQGNIVNTAYRASVLYNRKINARHTMRTGVIGQQ